MGWQSGRSLGSEANGEMRTPPNVSSEPEYGSLHGERDFAHVIKDLETGDYPGQWDGASVSPRGLQWGRQEGPS